ncbi:cytochrome P450 [Arabidopsis thaliana]|uniref:Cytochrome P450 71A16 n=1 Tax=Arabidopsis thaliana TaxID=3702 RepID=C71AG_ARATH|nr:cytochrome P450, family 71, subfamily A, polypeptide 16 [Arabidopsis thaliana]Q9FH66.1 RecName: Full=Cytochrome P450 71A16; AltName: Full=Marneral oxidase [Arabidopsis thaliana]ABH04567.1 At5g42590 [Arabidopsis thaliana]AED94832.1 cytochrome P450, family 71, subfamily A, polypeptide 16 [Arabidopsis thaliana]BAB09330.1 cytochrome P450 [Arabidopsis thaliana]|eukprot:NP_199073.1 cytochrome P450, family 71, subfamily A, polypeptide 16 [Arabidopsis thaliana]
MEMMILISLCLTTFLTILLFFKSLLKRPNSNLPPSPWRLPVIGNLHQLSLHPHRALSSLSARHGPLMLLRFGRVPVLIVSSADVAHDVMKTHDLKFANRPITKSAHKISNGGRDLVFAPYGEYWRNVKSLCTIHLLSNKMVQSSEKRREEEITLLMETLEEASLSSSSVNLSKLITNMVSDIMGKVVLGKKYSGEEGTIDVKTITKSFLDAVGLSPVGEYIPSLAWIGKITGSDGKLEKITKQFGDFIEKVLQEHEDTTADKETPDFVDMLLTIQRDETAQCQLDKSDLKVIIFEMFLGSTTTTSAVIEWAMTRLMRNPECLKKLQDEIRSVSKMNSYVSGKEVENMNYLKAVIKEVLRLHPPLPLLVPRLLSEDVKLKGYDITAGTQVIINAWAIQRDTATWGSDAQEFRPERHFDSTWDFVGRNFKYIPFGAGRRLCPGIGLGSVMASVTLANLVKRFDWRVEDGPSGYDKPDLVEGAGIDVCRKFPLVVFPSSA